MYKNNNNKRKITIIPAAIAKHKCCSTVAAAAAAATTTAAAATVHIRNNSRKPLKQITRIEKRNSQANTYVCIIWKSMRRKNANRKKNNNEQSVQQTLGQDRYRDRS